MVVLTAAETIGLPGTKDPMTAVVRDLFLRPQGPHAR